VREEYLRGGRGRAKLCALDPNSTELNQGRLLFTERYEKGGGGIERE